MKLLILLLWVTALQADVARSNYTCAGPVIDGVHYRVEILKSYISIPMSLNYDITTNSLYFVISDVSSRLAKIDLYSKEFSYISIQEDLKSFTARPTVSVDSQTSDIYVGSCKGVYKYNKISNATELYGASDADIWEVYSKDIVYFIESPSSFVYKIVDGEVSRLEDLKDIKVSHLLIDNDDYMIFSNDTGLFDQKVGSNKAVVYKGTGNSYVRSLTMNTYGDVYAALDDGIYVINKEMHQVDRILGVVECTGLAFDVKNNIIYSNLASVHRLLPSDDQDCV